MTRSAGIRGRWVWRGRVALGYLAVGFLGGGLACAPSVGNDPVPDEMEFEPGLVPPRVPEPTSLILNPATKKLDFSLAGTPVAADCTTEAENAKAQCEFLTYLQSLDGYPTTTPARTPTTATALIESTLTVGENIVVVDAKTGALVPDVTVGFDATTRYLTVTPNAAKKTWTVGAFYWLAVRGYEGGVRAKNDTAKGNLVVAAPAQFLLKQETSLTCGADTPASLSATCPAFQLLAQPAPGVSPEVAKAAAVTSVFQLEAIRGAYLDAGAWTHVAAAGLPKGEVAVLWGFPVHSASVAELDPTLGLVPRVVAADEIRIAVQGSVNPATVRSFVLTEQDGSVVVMDLDEAQIGTSLPAQFPAVDASYANGEIVIKARKPFVVGHQFGVFLKTSIQNTTGQGLVPSPVSKLLTLRGPLLNAVTGKSNVSAVSDADATMLESARHDLAALLDNPDFAKFSGVTREGLAYIYAFPFAGPQP